MFTLALFLKQSYMSNASDHLPAEAAAKPIHWVHTPGLGGRCIAALESTIKLIQ